MLEETEKRFKTLFDKFHDILFIANDQYQITYINSAIKKILGYDEAFCYSKSLLTFFHKEDQALAFKAVLNADSDIQNFQAALITINGGVAHCSISASIQKDGQNKNYYQGTIRDETNFKHIEKNYLHSEQQNESANFPLILAHEFRNPLNNIKLAVESLLPVINNKENVFLLEVIQRSCEKINELIRELLITSTPMQIKYEEVSFHKLLSGITCKLENNLLKRRIKLITSFEIVEININADAAKVEIAISNIIENAIEAVADVEGIIELKTVYHNKQLTFFIKDNGTSINKGKKGKPVVYYPPSFKNADRLEAAVNILKRYGAITSFYSNNDEGITSSIQFKV